MPVAIRQIHPVFVGEISGVDLTRQMSKDEVIAIEAGMDRYAVLVFRDQNVVGLIGGVLASGPLYLGLGYVLAKLGYQRKTLKEMRTPRAGVSTPETLTEDSRGRPAPTRRTTTGPSNRPRAKKRR